MFQTAKCFSLMRERDVVVRSYSTLRWLVLGLWAGIQPANYINSALYSSRVAI